MVTAKVAVGDAFEEIVKAAGEIDANLIAMSTHGRSELSGGLSAVPLLRCFAIKRRFR